MTEPTEKLPALDNPQADQIARDDKTMYDPQDLVSKGGYTGNPREIIENPAVAPEMLELPEDFHDDLLAEDDHER